MTKKNVIIPIPPIHCMNDLQNSRLLGNIVKSANIDVPVVVKPAVPSKIASINETLVQNKNGIPPKKEKTIHIMPQIKKAVDGENLFVLNFEKSKKPTQSDDKEGIKNPKSDEWLTRYSLSMKTNIKGMDKQKLSCMSRRPK